MLDDQTDATSDDDADGVPAPTPVAASTSSVDAATVSGAGALASDDGAADDGAADDSERTGTASVDKNGAADADDAAEEAAGEASGEATEDDDPMFSAVAYAYAEDDIETAATWLEEAFSDPARALFEGSSAIMGNANDDPSKAALARELSTTLLYRLEIDRGGPGVRPGARLGPLDGNSFFLPPIPQVPQPVVDLWAGLAERVTNPLPKSLLHDLLFTRQHGKVGVHGTEAITAYLAAASHTTTPRTQTQCLLRAWTLAKQMRRLDDQKSAREAMWLIVQTEAAKGANATPGVVLPMLTVLCQPTSPSKTAESSKTASSKAAIANFTDGELDAALDTFTTAFADQDHLVDRLVGLQIKRATDDSAAVEALNRRRVQSRLDRAEGASPPQLQMVFLQEAASLARDLGLRDMADDAVRAMQRIDPETFVWIKDPVKVSMPGHLFEGAARVFEEHGDWRAGLALWFDTRPPSGSYEDNVRSAREQMREHPLAYMLPFLRFGAHHMPERSQGDSDGTDAAVRRNEQMLALMQADLLANGLDRIRALTPDLTAATLTEWLIATYGCNPALAYRLARGILLFWEHQYDEAAHVVTSITEAGARSLLREVDEALYTVEKGKTQGGFPGLGAMLPLLGDNCLDEDWKRYLEVVLLPDGMNLRNVMAHGLVTTVDRERAVLVLRASAVLALITAGDSHTRDAAEVRKLLGQPIHIPRRSLLNRVRHATRAARWEFARKP